MAYVRRRGSQVLLVHGERNPETKAVEQRVLLTLYSKPEAREAATQLGSRHGGLLRGLLECENRDLRFDWKRIARAFEEFLPALPDEYDYDDERLRARFREGLRGFTRQLALTDPQQLLPSAQLVRSHRYELEWLTDLVQWRLRLCEQAESEWNRDNPFRWRYRLQGREVPIESEESAAELWEKRDLPRAKAVFQLLVESFENYGEGHNYLGLIALEEHRPQDAIESFRKAIERGRRLFPRRIARSRCWKDYTTRPYIRALGNLAIALNRAGQVDEALQACDVLEKECADRETAMMRRAPIFLNAGRWAEAAGAALHEQGQNSVGGMVAALALYETGRRHESLTPFLHAALRLPRTTRMLLGLHASKPRNNREVEDWNTGVYLGSDLKPYLARARDTLNFFARVAALPQVKARMREVEDLTRKWFGLPATEDPAAFQRLHALQSAVFARSWATEVAAALGISEDLPVLQARRRRRGPASAEGGAGAH